MPRLKDPARDENANHITRLIGKFQGQDIFVCGTGSSLLGFDWSRLNSRITIALNEAVRMPGFVPTVHLFSDQNLFNARRPNGTGNYESLKYGEKTLVVCQRKVRSRYLKSERFSDDLKRRVYQFHLLPDISRQTLKDDCLFLVNTVATAAILLAWKMGARRIFLVGIDGYKVRIRKDDGSTREVYYCDGSTKPKEKRKEKVHEVADRLLVVQDRHEKWIDQMNKTAAKIREHGNPYPGEWPGPGVFNCSKLSTITAWPKVELETVLRDQDESTSA